jgi:hypothetical protein
MSDVKTYRSVSTASRNQQLRSLLDDASPLPPSARRSGLRRSLVNCDKCGVTTAHAEGWGRRHCDPEVTDEWLTRLRPQIAQITQMAQMGTKVG